MVGLHDDGVVDADQGAVLIHQRAARVAGVDLGGVFNDLVNRGPACLAIGRGLGDDAICQREARVSHREACGVDLLADLNVTGDPVQVGEAVAVNVNHGQV